MLKPRFRCRRAQIPFDGFLSLGQGQLGATTSKDRETGHQISGFSGYEVKIVMKNQFNAMLLTAALAGLAGGSAVAAHAATQGTPQANQVKAAKAGLRYTSFDQDTTKHSCKGKNDCKGQGGCKSGDNRCSGKNSCKGKGGCATDGSAMPGLV